MELFLPTTWLPTPSLLLPSGARFSPVPAELSTLQCAPVADKRSLSPPFPHRPPAWLPISGPDLRAVRGRSGAQEMSLKPACRGAWGASELERLARAALPQALSSSEPQGSQHPSPASGGAFPICPSAVTAGSYKALPRALSHLVFVLAPDVPLLFHFAAVETEAQRREVRWPGAPS